MLARTLRALLDELGEGDRLSLVAFNSRGRVALPLRVMHAAGKEAARAAIDGLRAEGGTSIRAALTIAEGVLAASRPAGSVTACLLLSDGQDPRVQPADAAALGALAPVYTLGLGEDHDSALLSGIAATTGGTFAYAVAPDASE